MVGDGHGTNVSAAGAGRHRGSLKGTARELLLEEHEQRRAEIDALLARFEQDQRYGLAITGAVWAWFATNTDNRRAPLATLAVFLPALYR